MNKNCSLLLCALFLLSMNVMAQVGVGTTVPEGALDITSGTNGILIPRVGLSAKNVSAPVVNPNGGGTPVDGTLIWNTATSGVSPNNVTPGFYYWQGTSWKEIGSAGTNQWALLGNSGTTAGTNFVGTTDPQDLRFKTNNSDRFNISNSTFQLTSFGLGNVNAPTYSWNADSNTGTFSPGADQLGFVTGGTEKFRIPATSQVFAMSLGSAAAPFYSFNADPNTGIFSAGADIMNISTAGNERMRIEADGDVGINTTAPNASAKLEIAATDRGLLIPRVALTSRNAAGPITAPATSLLVYNTATAGTAPNNVVPGFYYWNGSAWVGLTGTGSNDWSTSGNAGMAGGSTAAAGTNFIGTTDASNLDFRTNNSYVGRFSSLGEFFVGTLNTVITGDLMNAVGNATFPWAINGYTSQNGGGVYGSVQGGGTIFGGVQGEYYGTHAQGTGVRGIYGSNVGGTSFGAAASGVNGAADNGSGSYKFGVHGRGGLSTRSGGVMGYDFGLAYGALGYYGSSGIDYSVYGFGLGYTTGTAAGRLAANPSIGKNTNIGLGIYGGAMGGWVRGLKYGFHTKGETYSLYVDGNGYTNQPLAFLIENPNGGDRIASYMNTSASPEMTANGKSTLQSGKVFIAFPNDFSAVISNIDDIVITATPQGKSNGIYIDRISKNGFWIYENNDGQSNVKISWIAITKIAGQENRSVPTDLLSADFDRKMDGVMFNENNTADTAQSLWWDGSKMRWDKPENTKTAHETTDFSRPKETKK